MLEFLTRHAVLRELATSTAVALGIYALCAIVVVTAERLERRDMSIYRSRNALNDLAYTAFYKCSIFNLLALPLYALLVPRLQFLRVGLLLPIPDPARLILAWVVFDFLHYWVHRLQHSVKPLWAFHSVHHAQTRLTFLTANRIHAVEQSYVGVMLIVPAFLLGVPGRLWLPLLAVQIFSESIQHARLDWTFGPLRRVIVSPVFHSVHHSTDEHEYNGNYGRVLSLWDAVFGTYVRGEPKEREYGVSGMDVPENLMTQFVHPFRYLAAPRG
jgi:sterol desaturase/sphingolipid hydroxylase (fatty acid hydroxylase superfamily)